MAGPTGQAPEPRSIDDLTEEELRDAYQVRMDPEAWFVSCGHIKDEETREVFCPETANVLQRRAFAAYRACMDQNRPARIIILKPRGRGGSSTAGAIAYHHGRNYRARVGVIGNLDDSSQNALDILRIMTDHDPFPHWQSTKTKDVEGVVQFSHDTIFETYTAESPDSARSARLQAYWATEVGRWQNGGALDAMETLESMRGALPKKGIHLCVEESTPQGASGAFYSTCQKARWPRASECPGGREWWRPYETDKPQRIDLDAGDSQFIFIFAAWFEFQASAKRNLTDAERNHIKSTLDDEEQRLIDRFGNDGPKGQRLGWEVDDADVWEQLAWRRAMIASEFNGSANKFLQEHASDPATCFLASGSPVFDLDGLTRLELMARQRLPLFVGTLDLHPSMGVTRRPDPGGWCQVWEEPREGMRYLVAADPASGKSQTESSGADAHSFLVVRDTFFDLAKVQHSPAVVARITPPCQVNPEAYGAMLEALSWYYGRCMVVPEMNNTGGGALIEQLRKRGVPFYIRQKVDYAKQGKITAFEGWQTDERTRRLIISELAWAILNHEIDVWCPHVVSELKTFVRKENGREEHADGCHDDDVLALAIGLHCLDSATVYEARNAQQQPSMPDDRYMRAALQGAPRDGGTW
jgi:hypothetical protein